MHAFMSPQRKNLVEGIIVIILLFMFLAIVLYRSKYG